MLVSIKTLNRSNQDRLWARLNNVFLIAASKLLFTRSQTPTGSVFWRLLPPFHTGGRSLPFAFPCRSMGTRNHGKIVAIDIETGAFEVDASEIEACDRLEARCPDAQIWIVRVGSCHVRRFGGRTRRTA
jgi:hypothetical protein